MVRVVPYHLVVYRHISLGSWQPPNLFDRILHPLKWIISPHDLKVSGFKLNNVCVLCINIPSWYSRGSLSSPLGKHRHVFHVQLHYPWDQPQQSWCSHSVPSLPWLIYFPEWKWSEITTYKIHEHALGLDFCVYQQGRNNFILLLLFAKVITTPHYGYQIGTSSILIHFKLLLDTKNIFG